VDGFNDRVQTVEVKTDANREAINALSEKLAGFQVETRARFDVVDQKFSRT
jgi:hypothetical protein